MIELIIDYFDIRLSGIQPDKPIENPTGKGTKNERVKWKKLIYF